jgi:hypothetical protein
LLEHSNEPVRRAFDGPGVWLGEGLHNRTAVGMIRPVPHADQPVVLRGVIRRVTAIGTLVSLGLLVIGVVGPDPSSSSGDPLVIGLALALIATFVRGMRMRLTLTKKQVVVYHWLRTDRVKWNEVAAIKYSPRTGFRIVRTDGRVVKVESPAPAGWNTYSGSWKRGASFNRIVQAAFVAARR